MLAKALINHFRYVDCCDGGCQVPPEAFGYRHCGRLLFIDRHGAVQPGIGSEQMDAQRTAASRESLLHWGFQLAHVAVRELADHAPLNYSSAVLGVRAPS